MTHMVFRETTGSVVLDLDRSNDSDQDTPLLTRRSDSNSDDDTSSIETLSEWRNLKSSCSSPTPARIVPPPTTSIPVAGKLDYLEGLRGVAALAVANAHIWLMDIVGDTTAMKYVQFLSVICELHVSLFFVLSGRVLVISFFKRRDPAIMASAAVKRPWRLGLPLLGMLIFHVILFNMGYKQETNDSSEHHSIVRILWAIPRFFIYSKSYPYPIFVQWTIGAEFWNSYYVYLYALIIAAIPRNKYLFHAIVISLAWYGRMWAACFFYGVFLSDFIQDGHMRTVMSLSSRTLVYIRTILCVILVIMCKGEMDKDHGLFKWFNTWVPSLDSGIVETNESWQFWNPSPIRMTGAILAVTLLEITPLLQRFFSLRACKFLGDISFMLYLGHPIVYKLIQNPIKEWVLAFGLWPWVSVTIAYFMIMSVNVALAYVMYRLIDMPSVEVTKWIDATLFGKPRPASAVDLTANLKGAAPPSRLPPIVNGAIQVAKRSLMILPVKFMKIVRGEKHHQAYKGV
ncbi:acyltransferase family-domain-containing protein [Fimicolochytrium jonesii]|uniref:acyltransferase family-domain-containing protein n=1 Tax=Fimicolochytrium jonesii TaxID=1396493 RepID=UPI0022FF4001|nr:acyltransferase family-domain-containing protein [Fimicolochytrium jonesii]KAI8819657.1 acyltransferase family-domain-containing protein [Fimicolochytrium jonesii]